LSSGDRIGDWKGHCLGVCLAGLKAVVQAAKESVKQVALRGSMSIAGETPTVVVRSSTGGETYGSEGPQVADRGQTVVLNRAMQDDEFLAAGAGDRRGTGIGLQATTICEPRAVVTDLGEQTC
jgi:hypothetical protein